MSESNQVESEAGGERRSNLLVPDVEPWPLDSDAPIIELDGVTKYFEGEAVLEDLSLEIHAGEITVVIGASGSGKTVLIKHMNGLVLPDEGDVRLFGESTREMSSVELDRCRKRIGTLFQSYALFDSMNVVENVAFPLVENGVMGRDEAQSRAEDLLETLDLEEALGKFPADLSGGMKKRVGLARALVTNPEVVLFDEATTGLDPIMMEFVDGMIEEATEEFSLTSVLISHDMASTFRLADTIAVLHEGTILMHDEPERVRKSDDERIRSLVRGITEEYIDHDKAAAYDSTAEGDDAVEFIDVSKSFSGLTVLDGVDMRVPEGEVTVLIGASGEGKSVMMKHILRLMEPDEGRVEVFGQDLAELSRSEMQALRTEIGMLFQHSALFDSMTVRENIAFPLVERLQMAREEANEHVDEMVQRLGIEGLEERYPPSISSGQRKRVSLARALVTEPPLVIYDEPTTGQDPMMTRKVEEMIREVQDNFEVTSLVISHDMALTFRIADRVAILAKGRIAAEGAPASLLESEDPEVQEFVYASEVGSELELEKEEQAASGTEAG